MSEGTPLDETPVDDPTPETPEAPAVEEVPAAEADVPAADTPWANDLAEIFADDSTRSQVDEFLRSKIQPYITKLEQESAPDRNAARLWDAFHSDPIATYEQVTREIYGEEEADRIMSAVRNQVDEEDLSDVDIDDELSDVSDEDTINMDKLPPEVREFVEEGLREKERQQYDALLSDVEKEMAAMDPPVPFKSTQFEPYLIAYDGDLDAAKAAYVEWVNEARQTFGLNLPKPGELQPPPTIGSDTQSAGGGAPPQQETYASFDDAIDSFFAEQKQPPPTMGSV